eukprot:2682001-Rhodomonas_salina.1
MSSELTARRSQEFEAAWVQAITDLYGQDPKSSPSLGRLVDTQVPPPLHSHVHGRSNAGHEAACARNVVVRCEVARTRDVVVVEKLRPHRES